MATALIIGASRGLGKALVEEHLKRGWQVIATVRKADVLEDLRASSGGKLEVETLDTADFAGIDTLRKKLDGRTLDLLFVNAGIAGPSAVPIGVVEPGPFAELMLVNALAPLRIVEILVDLVPEGGTAAVMSSSLGSITLNVNGGWEAYRMSKAALDMGLRSVSVRRAGDGRTYLAIDPGWVRTDMGGPEANLAIEESIPSLVDTLAKRGGKPGMAFVNYQNQDHPW
jgi:NAD(P)-dependent dehydrogenase (short-subunit alcohol dehydrogenase family)